MKKSAGTFENNFFIGREWSVVPDIISFNFIVRLSQTSVNQIQLVDHALSRADLAYFA